MTKNPNLLYGLRAHGQLIHAGVVGGGYSDSEIGYLPDVFDVVAYNKDGTKSAIFASGVEDRALEKVTFEIQTTGCAKAEFIFRYMPDAGELYVDQRIDIHLFNDPRPWWSGYIMSCPVSGGTAEKYQFNAQGYYNKLDKIVLFRTFQQMETSDIVARIAREAEIKAGLTYARRKLINTNYEIARLDFDGVTVKDALNQLKDFAVDYIYGVDEYRQMYFKPRSRDINEQARFWVDRHLKKFEPVDDVEKIVNVIIIKGAAIDSSGEQWLATVTDPGSQQLYGIREKVMSLPSAYDQGDAVRWGQNQLENLAKPKESAKVEIGDLSYPRANGSFAVRKLTVDGEAGITDINGVFRHYPITKLKYTISAADGIKCEMELGTQPESIDSYLIDRERAAKSAELLQQASTKQLKTGG